jgi:hypothetical protein
VHALCTLSFLLIKFCLLPKKKKKECSKPMLAKGRTHILENVVEVEKVGESEDDELVGGDEVEEEGVTLVMKKTLLAPRKEDDEEWLRDSIFYSTCNILGKVCPLVIDGRSCENVVSQEAIDNLGFKTEEHPNPYKLSSLKKDGEIKVTKRCLVHFQIGRSKKNVVSCDVAPMDVCHLLLGRLWQYDRDTCHNARTNTYSRMPVILRIAKELFRTYRCSFFKLCMSW